MFITRIQLENFRNFKSLDLKTDQGFAVFSGANSAGKTNFLEAVYFDASLLRFPESKLGQFFQFGESFFRINIGAKKKDGEIKLGVFYEQTETGYRSQFKIDSQKAPRARHQGQLPVVAFLPQDLIMLSRSPGNRRRFLDEVLSAVSAQYRHSLAQFKQALKQRNDLWQRIKQGERVEEELEIWNAGLAEHGSLITKERKFFFDFLNQNLSKVMTGLSPELSGISIVYRASGFEEKQGFLDKLAGARAKELDLGTTIIGPHRDDFEVINENKNIIGIVSRGQLRAVILGLKILEREYLAEHIDESPVMLLDDVMSEFDDDHQARLMEFLKGFEQVFLTTAHLHEIKDGLPETAQIYNVKDGEIAVN